MGGGAVGDNQDYETNLNINTGNDIMIIHWHGSLSALDSELQVQVEWAAEQVEVRESRRSASAPVCFLAL